MAHLRSPCRDVFGCRPRNFCIQYRDLFVVSDGVTRRAGEHLGYCGIYATNNVVSWRLLDTVATKTYQTIYDYGGSQYGGQYDADNDTDSAIDLAKADKKVIKNVYSKSMKQHSVH